MIIKPDISLGNILTILVLLSGVFAAWYNVKGTADSALVQAAEAKEYGAELKRDIVSRLDRIETKLDNSNPRDGR